MAFGWPEIKVFDMPFEAKLICLTIIVGNFMMLLGSSCVLYIAILRKRGQFCISKISSIDQEGNNSSETSLNQKRENSEINAAILSLETNLVLYALGCVSFLILTTGSDNLVVIILILIKGLTPILTTIANFVKIQELMFWYWENSKVSLLFLISSISLS